MVGAVLHIAHSVSCRTASTRVGPGDRLEIRTPGHLGLRPGAQQLELVAATQDPWLRLPCPPDPAGCSVRFQDPEFVAGGRDALYYARVLQEATPAVNGAGLRTRFDAGGTALSVDPCYADPRTAFDDECLAPVQERAWSSPIFVDLPR